MTTRNWYSVSQSQVDLKNRHAPTQEDALENVQYAYCEIFTQLSSLGLPYLAVAYEAITSYGERAVRPLLKELGLTTGPVRAHPQRGRRQTLPVTGGVMGGGRRGAAAAPLGELGG